MLMRAAGDQAFWLNFVKVYYFGSKKCPQCIKAPDEFTNSVGFMDSNGFTSMISLLTMGSCSMNFDWLFDFCQIKYTMQVQ